jgi:hypothetical protein
MNTSNHNYNYINSKEIDSQEGGGKCDLEIHNVYSKPNTIEIIKRSEIDDVCGTHWWNDCKVSARKPDGTI